VRLLPVVLALLLAATDAAAANLPLALPEPNEALLFALGLIGLGAGLSRPPEGDERERGARHRSSRPRR